MFLRCVPGHVGTQGNELTDKFAREGSSLPFNGAEPLLAIFNHLLRGTVL